MQINRDVTLKATIAEDINSGQKIQFQQITLDLCIPWLRQARVITKTPPRTRDASSVTLEMLKISNSELLAHVC